MNLFNYSRRESCEVQIGGTPLGGDNPIRVQSMTTTATTDTEGSVGQARRIIEAGGEYVRLTTQGVREAENLREINAGLRSQGITTPLVADVHFNARVADVAALYAEKVRINPVTMWIRHVPSSNSPTPMRSMPRRLRRYAHVWCPSSIYVRRTIRQYVSG